MSPDVTIPSPCNSDCLIDHNSQLCKGCLRTIDEIIHWTNFSDEEKQMILNKVEVRKESLTDQLDE